MLKVNGGCAQLQSRGRGINVNVESRKESGGVKVNVKRRKKGAGLNERLSA